MAFYTNLIAMSTTEDKYEIVSQISSDVNTRLLREDKLFDDVSESNFYLDEMAVILKDKFEKYLYKKADNPVAYKWFKSLPSDVKLILVHKLEWESGLSD